MTLDRVEVLGCDINLLSREEIVDAIERFVADRRHGIIANHNLHSIYLSQNDEQLREFFRNAELTHVDGMGVVMLARLSGHPEVRRIHRTTYIDLAVPLFARAAARNWRVFYLGSKPGVDERAASFFRSRHPGLQLRTHHGFFSVDRDGSENRAVLKEIADYRPDLLIVGMGMPRQEKWLAENFEQLSAHAFLCSGAMMDYYAGEIPTPPRWIGAIGLEWAFRLFSEPTRLWRRYLVEPWVLLKLLLTRSS